MFSVNSVIYKYNLIVIIYVSSLLSHKWWFYIPTDAFPFKLDHDNLYIFHTIRLMEAVVEEIIMLRSNCDLNNQNILHYSLLLLSVE